jgi:hypothetical protein
LQLTAIVNFDHSCAENSNMNTYKTANNGKPGTNIVKMQTKITISSDSRQSKQLDKETK